MPTRSGRPPTRFRDGACHPAGSLSISALPPDANGRCQRRRTEKSNPSAFTPGRFPSGASTLTGSSSRAEGGAVEAHARDGHALVSSEARPPGRFTFPSTSRGIRTRTTGGLDAVTPACWSREACERLTGFEPATSTLATSRSDLLSYNRMSPPPVPTRAARPYQGRADADPKGIVPGAGLEPACACFKGRPYKGRPVVGPGGQCPRRDSNAHCPDSHSGASCRWATRTQSRHPGSNRAIRRTKAKPQAVRGGEATLPGFEPGTSWFRAKRCCRLS